MGPDAILYTKTVHIFGTLMWIGCLFGLYQVIFTHGKTDEAGRKVISELESKMAMAMDIGLLITLGGGIALIFGIGASIVMKQPWIHIKLTMVALLIAAHVYARIKVKKFRGGDTSTPPEALFALLNLFLVGILIMAIVKPIK
jgi:putative membrane protein